MTTIDVVLLGERGRVEVADPALADELAAVLADVRVDPAGVPTLPLIDVAGAPGAYEVRHATDDHVRRLHHAAGVIAWVVSRWNREVLHGSDHVCVHTGAVVGPAGAVLLPAASGSGKSTLTAAAVRAGLGYLSDEAIAFDRSSGALLAYPKPLSLKVGSWRLLPGLLAAGPDADPTIPHHVAASALRAGAVAAPAPVVAIAFPTHVAGGPTRLDDLGRAEALVELATDTIRFDARARDTLDLLAGVVRAASCHRLDHHDLDEAVAAIARLAGVSA